MVGQSSVFLARCSLFCNTAILTNASFWCWRDRTNVATIRVLEQDVAVRPRNRYDECLLPNTCCRELVTQVCLPPLSFGPRIESGLCLLFELPEKHRWYVFSRLSLLASDARLLLESHLLRESRKQAAPVCHESELRSGRMCGECSGAAGCLPTSFFLRGMGFLEVLRRNDSTSVRKSLLYS